MMADHYQRADFRTRIQEWLPKIVLSPSVAAMLVFVYGFIALTIYLSFSGSKMSITASPITDVEAFAKKISFGKVTDVDVAARSVKVDFVK